MWGKLWCGLGWEWFSVCIWIRIPLFKMTMVCNIYSRQNLGFKNVNWIRVITLIYYQFLLLFLDCCLNSQVFWQRNDFNFLKYDFNHRVKWHCSGVKRRWRNNGRTLPKGVWKKSELALRRSSVKESTRWLEPSASFNAGIKWILNNHAISLNRSRCLLPSSSKQK